MKQETLEEAIDKASLLEFPIKEWYRSDDYNREEITAARDGFKRGSKWQQERSYSEDEVRELLETQRGNCYVALLSHTKNDDISSISLQSPEPGGKNGTWVKSI